MIMTELLEICGVSLSYDGDSFTVEDNERILVTTNAREAAVEFENLLTSYVWTQQRSIMNTLGYDFFTGERSNAELGKKVPQHYISPTQSIPESAVFIDSNPDGYLLSARNPKIRAAFELYCKKNRLRADMIYKTDKLHFEMWIISLAALQLRKEKGLIIKPEQAENLSPTIKELLSGIINAIKTEKIKDSMIPEAPSKAEKNTV